MERHQATGEFSEYFQTLKEKHPQLQVIINGHTHHNTHHEHAGCHYVSCSSLVESSFECKIFTIDAGNINMHTHSLANDIQFFHSYDWNKTHVQGRLCDRSFTTG